MVASGLTDFVGDALDLQVQVDAIGLGAVFALMAVGIGLVFGVMRLVNFAYGQLIMAGAFALAYASDRDWPVGIGIALCFAVVLALSLAMERVVFRPLRSQSAAVMLIATFAVAFLLQSIALLWFGPLGKTATSLVELNRPVSVGGVEIRKITIVAIVTAAVCLLLLVLLLNRTSIGLHMRAAAMDFPTARLLGVRANLVSTVAVLIAGVLAAVVAVMLTVQFPTVTPTFALQETILVLAGVVVGGMTRLLSATLGGFFIGYVSGLLGGALPSSQSQYLPSFLFGLVILVLLVRPDGLFTRRPRSRGASVRARRAAVELLAPAVLVVVAGVIGAFVSQTTQIYFITALISVSTVVAIYVFVGNSGVLSFGHISFFAVGVWAAGVLTVPEQEKPATMPYLFDFLSSTTVGNVPSLLIAGAVGGVFALLVGLPLMRLSGLAAGIATFAVLGITNNILRYYEKIGPGLNTFSSVPETTDLLQATIGAVLVIVAAFAYQRSRLGRQLRATREDPAAARAVGVSIYRQRLASFALSGFLAGFAGGLYIHFIPINVDAVYLDLTFITLAMLVIGGTTSLWGAVVGALFVSGLDSFLAETEDGMTLLGRTIDLPSGSQDRRRERGHGARARSCGRAG